MIHPAGVGNIGDGRLDNIIIDRSAHLVSGTIVLITMILATAMVLRHALRNEAVARPAMLAMIAAQLSLTVQLLLGIKLLDQGQGIVQLYIHYIGGLVPLGAFLVGGWVARGDSGRSSRILAGLLLLGCFSALMAFFIGRAYVNSVIG
ncbi:MAG: hypothetical protein ACRBK7_19420 [Acidimicrobiales bacterium]